MLIKYPISNPPTQAQLDAIPMNIWSKWIQSIQLEGGESVFNSKIMQEALQAIHTKGDWSSDAYEKLLHTIYMIDE